MAVLIGKLNIQAWASVCVCVRVFASQYSTTLSSKSVTHSRQSTMLKLHCRTAAAAAGKRWMGGVGGAIKGYKVRKGGRANERKSAGKGCWTVLRSILITTYREWPPLISNNSEWRGGERGTQRRERRNNMEDREMRVKFKFVCIAISVGLCFFPPLSFFLFNKRAGWTDGHVWRATLSLKTWCNPSSPPPGRLERCVCVCVECHTIWAELDCSKSISQ